MTRVRVVFTTRGALFAVVLGLAAVFVWTVRSVLTPFIWALIVAYILDPLVRWFDRRLGIRRFLVVLLLFTLLVGSLVWGLAVLQPIIVDEGRELVAAAPRIAADVQAFILGNERIDIHGIVIDPAAIRSQLMKAIQDAVPELGLQAIPFLVRALNTAVHLVLFLIATFYLLLDLDKLGPALVGFLPRRWRLQVIPLLIEMESVLGRYIRGQVLLIVIMTTASWIVLTVLGIRYSLLMAIATGILEIFPVIGPWSAGAIAVSVALTQPTPLFGGNSAILAAVVGAAYFILRQLEDIFVIPNVVGKVMNLHPLLVLFALTTGGYLGGLLGVLIAVPITAVIRVYLRFLHDRFMEDEQPSRVPRRAQAKKADAPAPPSAP